MRPFGHSLVSLKKKSMNEVRTMPTTQQVWEDFHVPLRAFITKRVPDETTAEDILQEVFLKIHQHSESLSDVRKLEGWVYQITRHAIIDWYRAKRITTSLESSEALSLPEELPNDDVVSDLFPSIQAMLRSLPERDRQALILTEYQGLTQKELAKRLGLSFSGAKSRVQRAREKLKQLLLACCHFEFDRRGHVIDYHPRCTCCENGGCCPSETFIEASRSDNASFFGVAPSLQRELVSNQQKQMKSIPQPKGSKT